MFYGKSAHNCLFLCRFILHAKKTAFVIEHDFIMATYLADRVIVFQGKPAVAATATPYVVCRLLSSYVSLIFIPAYSDLNHS